MNFNFDQALEATLTLALQQLEELENGIGDVRKHSAPTRYRQRKSHSFIDEKYNTASPQDFQVNDFFYLLTFLFGIRIKEIYT